MPPPAGSFRNGIDLIYMHRRAAIYIDHILNWAKAFPHLIAVFQPCLSTGQEKPFAATSSAVNTERVSRWADVPQRDTDGFLPSRRQLSQPSHQFSVED